MARKRTTSSYNPHEDIIRWYREALDAPARVPWEGVKYQPVCVGPTWQIDDGKWKLPELTLGWDVLGFNGTWLQHERGVPWRFTLEQARFILWWFAIDESGRFLYRDGVLQRLKGHGKDPLGACLLFTEAFGPCRFAGWDGDRPLATDVPDAWVQTAAVAQEQTKNTMRLFPTMVSDEAIRCFGIQIGKETIYGLGDSRFIQAVTSSPTTLEGARATFLLLNETQHWTSSNEGHDMADVIERNATKSPGGAARTLAITNAYEPSEDSVAQRTREAYEKAVAGQSLMTGLLYDSLEADPKAPLAAEAAPQVVVTIRGDSVWLDPQRIVQSILDPRNPPSRSRRFWYNQITASEDAWVSPQEWDAQAKPEIIVTAGDVITLGFDGSLTNDHCALVGCHVETDHIFLIEAWAPPKDGLVDRRAIDRKVRETKELYDVVGFFSDLHPWESYVDTWAEDFGQDLPARASQRHPIAFDLRDSQGSRVRDFTLGCENTLDGILNGKVSHDGTQRLRWYMLNARRDVNKWGIAIRKEHRDSAKKIDAADAAVLARLARAAYLALPESKRRRKNTAGSVWI